MDKPGLWNKVRLQINMLSATLTDDARRMRLQFIAVYGLLAAVSLFMTVVNVLTGKYLLMAATIVFAVLSIGNVFLALRGPKGLKVSSVLFSVEIIALLTFFIISGTPEGFSAIWICLIPASGLLLYGRKRGTVVCGVMLVIMLFFFDTPLGNSFLQYPYTASFKLRFPMLYVAFFALSFFLETVRMTTHAAMLKATHQYEYLYAHDALTDVYNRYGFNEQMDLLLKKPSDSPITLMIVDIDYFKNVNDLYGHPSGDVVLKEVARLLTRLVGDRGVVCRWGGEEFALLSDKLSDGEASAQRVRKAIEELTVETGGQTVSVTVSIGVLTAAPGEHVLPAPFVTQTDACLYEAKEHGRNRVVAGLYRPGDTGISCEIGQKMARNAT